MSVICIVMEVVEFEINLVFNIFIFLVFVVVMLFIVICVSCNNKIVVDYYVVGCFFIGL